MNTLQEPAGGHGAPSTVCCVLAGHAAVRVPVEAVAELRKRPGPPCGSPPAANFLKHADEQTVAGLAAVFQAIQAHGLAPEGTPAVFRDWGVVAAPRFLGRSAMATDLPRFLAEGAWDVSPHMIPHRSLHSMSGTISQALKIHGPNFGAGGGPGCEVEALLAGVALLEGLRLPGVWVVLTCLEPELPDDGKTGRPAPGTFCRGLALALQPAGAAGPVHVELTIGACGEAASGFTLGAFVKMFERLAQPSSSVAHALPAAGRLTLHRAPAPLAGPHFALLSCERSHSIR